MQAWLSLELTSLSSGSAPALGDRVAYVIIKGIKGIDSFLGLRL